MVTSIPCRFNPSIPETALFLTASEMDNAAAAMPFSANQMTVLLSAFSRMLPSDAMAIPDADRNRLEPA